MILLNIKQYILQHKEVTLSQLAKHFHMPESAIEAMADVWVSKGILEKLTLNCSAFHNAAHCGQCLKGCQTLAIQEFNHRQQVLYRPK